jgi:hypothetical protein
MFDYFSAGASLVVFLGGLVAWFRWLRPKWRSAKADVVAGRDALLGRDAVHDSITGKEIAPALPGIGQRVTTLEEAIPAISVALTRMSDMHVRVSGVEDRVGRLERMEGERSLARTESIELLRTIDNAIKADPKED